MVSNERKPYLISHRRRQICVYHCRTLLIVRISLTRHSYGCVMYETQAILRNIKNINTNWNSNMLHENPKYFLFRLKGSKSDGIERQALLLSLRQVFIIGHYRFHGTMKMSFLFRIWTSSECFVEGNITIT